MAEVIDFPWLSDADLDPDRVLEECKGKLSRVMILGWTTGETDSDREFYTNTSFADGPDMLWLMELTREKLMSHARRLREERSK